MSWAVSMRTSSACNGTRKKAGEFYTPTFVVDYMVDLLDLDNDDRLEDRKFIDIACGTGAFLVAGMRKVDPDAEGAGHRR